MRRGSGKTALCQKLDITGPVPMKHLLEDVYSRKSKKCRECGVCEAFLQSKTPTSNVVPILPSLRVRKGVRPPKHQRLHRKKIVKTVSVGMGTR